MLQKCGILVSACIIERGCSNRNVCLLGGAIKKPVSQCNEITVSIVKSIDRQNDLAGLRVFEMPIDKVGTSIGAGKCSSDGARLWPDCELNALENARIASQQMHVADKRRRAWRLTRNSYVGVIGLIGPGNGREEYEHASDNGDGERNNFHDAF